MDAGMIVSHQSKLVLFYIILAVGKVRFVCSTHQELLCILAVPENARATIARPLETSNVTKILAENDGVLHGKASPCKPVLVNYTWIALFECAPGYTLIGRNFLTCAQDSEWDGEYPSCLPNKCFWFDNRNNDVKFVYNKQLLSPQSSGFPVGTELTFTDSACSPGYLLNNKASPTVNCSDNGQWTGMRPNCVPAPSSCPFDGSRKNVLFEYHKKALNNASVHYPEGTIVLDFDQNVTCSSGAVAQDYLVKICEKGKWIVSEHPCVEPGVIGHLLLWGSIVTLLSLTLFIYILNLRCASRQQPAKNSQPSDNTAPVSSVQRKELAMAPSVASYVTPIRRGRKASSVASYVPPIRREAIYCEIPIPELPDEDTGPSTDETHIESDRQSIALLLPAQDEQDLSPT